MEKNSPEFWAAVGATGGAILTKLAGALIQAFATFFGVVFQGKISESDQIRKELRDRTKDLEDKIAEVYEQVDEWRKKYYEQLELNSQLRDQCRRMQTEIDALKTASKAVSINH